LTTLCYFYSNGRYPDNLKIGIVNHEYQGSDCPFNQNCSYDLLSCRYISFLEKRKVALEYFNDSSSAIDQLTRGNVWLTLEISANYSKAVDERMTSGQWTEDDILDMSTIDVVTDSSIYWFRLHLEKQVRDSFQDFTDDLLTSCDYAAKTGRIPPMSFETPIFGDEEATYTEFIAPGYIIV
jgi:hypothetical protein